MHYWIYYFRLCFNYYISLLNKILNEIFSNFFLIKWNFLIIFRTPLIFLKNPLKIFKNISQEKEKNITEKNLI